MTKTATALKQEVKANTSEMKARVQWMKAAAQGKTQLGFNEWYDVKVAALINSWMTH